MLRPVIRSLRHFRTWSVSLQPRASRINDIRGVVDRNGSEQTPVPRESEKIRHATFANFQHATPADRSGDGRQEIEATSRRSESGNNFVKQKVLTATGRASATQVRSTPFFDRFRSGGPMPTHNTSSQQENFREPTVSSAKPTRNFDQSRPARAQNASPRQENFREATASSAKPTRNLGSYIPASSNYELKYTPKASASSTDRRRRPQETHSFKKPAAPAARLQSKHVQPAPPETDVVIGEENPEIEEEEEDDDDDQFLVQDPRLVRKTAEEIAQEREAAREQKIVDRVRLLTQGGNGGTGWDGGAGGSGGNVIVMGARNHDLRLLRAGRFIAPHGANSQRGKGNAKPGRNIILQVPAGTQVFDAELKELVVDIDKIGQKFVVAKGGMGGGLHTETNVGEKGQRRLLHMELKSLADIGLIGFPNAGKSTLLRALSRARPKVGAYPCSVNFDDAFHTIVVADVPGLVEGASENRGMGHRFLRHLERTKGLIYVLDVEGFQLSQRDTLRTLPETFELLYREVAQYGHGMQHLPYVIAINKVERPEQQSVVDEFKAFIKKYQSDLFMGVVVISAQNGTGLEDVRASLLRIIPPNRESVDKRKPGDKSFREHISVR